MSENQTIEKLDPNFQAEAVQNEVQWHDAREFLLEGQGWPDEAEDYCRLPNRAENVVRNPVWNLSRHSAGLKVLFATDAPYIAARWTVQKEPLAMPHMPASGVSGIDLYARDGKQWRWAAMGRATQFPENEAVLLDEPESVKREYALYLPLYNGTRRLEIGIQRGTISSVTPTQQKPIVFYGTSIVQGGCASRPGMAYPAILGRRLDCPTINLGFSGNGKAEPEIAQLLAELDPSVYVLDCLPNMSPDEVSERIVPLIETIRAAHPSTPIVMMENITYTNSWINSGRNQACQDKNLALRAAIEDLITLDANFYLVEGENLLGDDGEGTVDGTHPTDVGFLCMAQALEPVLRKML